MGNLTNDMARLRDEITVMSNARRAQMIDREIENEKMKTGVSNMLMGMREAHEAMAREANADRAKFVSDLTADVYALREMFHKELARSTAKRKRDRQDLEARLKKAVADLRGDTLRMMKDHREALGEMVMTSKKEREDVISSLRKEVSVMQETFHRFQAHLGKMQRKELHGFIADLKQTVDSLVGGFASDRAGARDAWHRPVMQERKSRAEAAPKTMDDAGAQADEEVQSAAANTSGQRPASAAGVGEGEAKEPAREVTESAPGDSSPGKSRKKGKK